LCEENIQVSKTHFCAEPCEEALHRYNENRYTWGSDEDYPYLPASILDSIQRSARETWFESIRSLTAQPINERQEVYSTKPLHPPGDNPYNDWKKGDKYKVNKWRAYYAWIINSSKIATKIRLRERKRRSSSSQVFANSIGINDFFQKRCKIEDERHEERIQLLRGILNSVHDMCKSFKMMAQSLRIMQAQLTSSLSYISCDSRVNGMRYTNSSPMQSHNGLNSNLSPVVMSLDDHTDSRLPQLENK